MPHVQPHSAPPDGVMVQTNMDTMTVRFRLRESWLREQLSVSLLAVVGICGIGIATTGILAGLEGLIGDAAGLAAVELGLLGALLFGVQRLSTGDTALTPVWLEATLNQGALRLTQEGRTTEILLEDIVWVSVESGEPWQFLTIHTLGKTHEVRGRADLALSWLAEVTRHRVEVRREQMRAAGHDLSEIVRPPAALRSLKGRL